VCDVAAKLKVSPSKVKDGDRLLGSWTALEDARRQACGQITLEVQYEDGGIGQRVWDNDKPMFEITRGA
jgi:hypothetical protein